MSTFISLNSGTYFDSGSVSWNLPSSNSINKAADVIGFVIEYIRKMSSERVARPVARSAFPYASTCTTLP